MKRPDATVVMTPPAGHMGTLVAGRYRLAAQIGTGGTADVWRAYDESRDRAVTLKILRDPEDAEARRRFLAEARRLETLDHPAIVPVVGLQDAQGVTLIAYEHVEGEPLNEFAARGPLPPRQLALIVLQLADAVEALHTHGFVHLDLKPENVLIGADGRPRLIDFGTAEPIGHPPEVPRGTHGYASPEVRAGAATSRASDVYGLAAIAKRLIGDHLTPRVATVLQRGLETNPFRRYRRPRYFAYAFGIAVFVDEELAVAAAWLQRASAMLAPLRTHVSALLAPLGARARTSRVGTYVRARPELSFRMGAVALIVTGVLVGQLWPSAPATPSRTTPASTSSTVMPTLVRPPYEAPPLSAYAAAFEAQAPYPLTTPNSTVEWTVALRNTGTAGWYRGIDGAQASLILEDGTFVAVQSTDYVGPNQVGWFTARLTAPSQLGTHMIALRPAINGRGPLRDLGIYALVTVVAKR